jgi:hypothetical protein
VKSRVELAVADAGQSVTVAVARPDCDGRGAIVAGVGRVGPKSADVAVSPMIFTAAGLIAIIVYSAHFVCPACAVGTAPKRDQPTPTFQPWLNCYPSGLPEAAYPQVRFVGLVSYGITEDQLPHDAQPQQHPTPLLFATTPVSTTRRSAPVAKTAAARNATLAPTPSIRLCLTKSALFAQPALLRYPTTNCSLPNCWP